MSVESKHKSDEPPKQDGCSYGKDEVDCKKANNRVKVFACMNLLIFLFESFPSHVCPFIWLFIKTIKGNVLLVPS